MKHRVHVDGAVIAHIFAERPFRLDIAALVEIALERHLGVGGNENIVGQAFHHRRRLGAEAGDQRQLIARLPRGRGEEIERMRADRECHRQFLAARHRSGVDALEVGRRGNVGAGFGAVAQAQAAAADIAAAGRRIDGVVDGRAAIAAAVIGVLRMERQLGEIDVLAGDLDIVHRGVAGRHLDQRLRAREPSEIFVVELVLAGLEGGGEALAVARGLGDQLDLLGAGLLEQHRLVGALDDRAQAGERHRLVVNLDLAELDQALDEAAQAVFVEIDGGGMGHRWLTYFLDRTDEYRRRGRTSRRSRHGYPSRKRDNDPLRGRANIDLEMTPSMGVESISAAPHIPRQCHVTIGQGSTSQRSAAVLPRRQVHLSIAQNLGRLVGPRHRHQRHR